MNFRYIKNFALFNYKLKAVEHNPWRLLYDRTSSLSKLIKSATDAFPKLSFAELSELTAMRKNAVVVLVLGGLILGFVLQRLLFLCL